MLHLISVTAKSEVFFDVGGDNQQPRLRMGDCDGNFEIGKIIDDATTIEVKVESYIHIKHNQRFHPPSGYKGSSSLCIQCCVCIKNFCCNAFYAKVFIRDR